MHIKKAQKLQKMGWEIITGFTVCVLCFNGGFADIGVEICEMVCFLMFHMNKTSEF